MDKTATFRAKCLKSLLFIVKLTISVECGGNYATMNGTITSPADLNNMYPNNADCMYQITVPAMYTIFLKVDRLILQDKSMETGCSDFLEVRTITIKLGEHDLYRYRMLHQIELCRKEQRNSLQLKCHHVLKFLTPLFIRYGKNYASKVYLVWHFNIINK